MNGQDGANKGATPGTHAMSALENSAVAIADKLRVVSAAGCHHKDF